MNHWSRFATVIAIALTFAGAAQAQKLAVTGGRSSWGYDVPVPFHQLDRLEQGFLLAYEGLPIDTIGAVKVQSPPFRATAFYLGEHNGMHLFATSAHVVILNDQQKVFAVEMGHLDEASKFSVPVEEKPLFASLNEGDMAIVRAKSDLSADIKRRLAKIKPAVLSLGSVATLMQKYPSARFYVAGRGKFAHARADQDEPSQAGLWSAKSITMWKNSAAEADANQDEFTHMGDILAIAEAKVYSGGIERPMRDPDGLVVGQDDGDPFLSAPVTLAPNVVAISSRTLGRMSGAPLMMTYWDGLKKKTVVVGVGYTAGIPENLRSPNSSILREMRARPARAFGEVVIAEKTVNGATVPFLSLKQTAPFSFMATVSGASRNLQLLATEAPSVIGQAERDALKKLIDSSAL